MRGMIKPGNHAQKSSLPAAGWPKKGQKFIFADGNRDVIDCADFLLSIAENFRNAANLNCKSAFIGQWSICGY